MNKFEGGISSWGASRPNTGVHTGVRGGRFSGSCSSSFNTTGARNNLIRLCHPSRTIFIYFELLFRYTRPGKLNLLPSKFTNDRWRIYWDAGRFTLFLFVLLVVYSEPSGFGGWVGVRVFICMPFPLCLEDKCRWSFVPLIKLAKGRLVRKYFM